MRCTDVIDVTQRLTIWDPLQTTLTNTKSYVSNPRQQNVFHDGPKQNLFLTDHTFLWSTDQPGYISLYILLLSHLSVSLYNSDMILHIQICLFKSQR